MNWKQFKDHLEELGVTDAMEFKYMYVNGIDVAMPSDICVYVDTKRNEFQVSDVR